MNISLCGSSGSPNPEQKKLTPIKGNRQRHSEDQEDKKLEEIQSPELNKLPRKEYRKSMADCIRPSLFSTDP